MPRIELIGLTRQFSSDRRALREIALDVPDGEIHAILGPSGSGKSTLLRLIAGLDHPTSGRIVIGSEEATNKEPRDRDVAMVFQNQAPFPHLDVAENLAFSARARGVSRREIAERVQEVAGQLGLANALTRMPSTLSGGERQRVALGRAIVRRPSILLLDEPFSNLDLPLRRDLRTHLLDFHRELGVTTLFVTHDQQEAVAVGNRVTILHEGQIRQTGRVEELFESPQSLFVGRFLGDPPMGSIRVSLEPCDEGWNLLAKGEPIGIIPRESGGTGLPRGTPNEAILGIRSGHVTLDRGESASSQPTLTLPLRSIEVQGLERFGRLGDDDGMWLDLPRSGLFEIGMRLTVRWELAKACWFDPVSGLRLGPRTEP